MKSLNATLNQAKHRATLIVVAPIAFVLMFGVGFFLGALSMWDEIKDFMGVWWETCSEEWRNQE